MSDSYNVTVIPQDDDRCGWYESLPSVSNFASLKGEQSFDIAIIGAGYTGLAAARRLGELLPDKQIALIDAQRIGLGAAGRSSGFAIDLAHDVRSKSLVAGLSEAKKQTWFNRAGLAYLENAVKERNVDCDWDPIGKIHAAATVKGQSKLGEFSQVLERLNESYQWLSAGEMKEKTGSAYYKKGLYAPGTVLLQPAALVRGLKEVLPENVTVYEDSAITEVHYKDQIKLISNEGEINTKQLLLTNNGYAKYFGFYKHHLIPLMTYGSFTRRLSDSELAELGGDGAWGIIPADPFGTSLRKTKDNRLLVRHTYGYADQFKATKRMLNKMHREHRVSFERRFPNLKQVEFEYTWGGALCLSRNGAPVFGELAKNVFGAFCLNGVGISRGTIMGKLLAEQVAGQSSDMLTAMQTYPRPNLNPPGFIMKFGVGLELKRREICAGIER